MRSCRDLPGNFPVRSTAMVLGFSGRHSHVFEDGDPLAAVVFRLQIRRNEALRSGLGLLEEGGAVGPVDPAVEHEDGAVGWRGGAEVDLDGVLLRDAAEVSGEAVDVAAVSAQDALGDVLATFEQHALRIDAARGTKKAEFGVRRRLPLVVSENLDLRRVVDGDELDLVEVADLGQLFW